MSNGLTFTKFLPMLGHDWEMSCAKFQEDRFRIDGEIDEKHGLQIIEYMDIEYMDTCVFENIKQKWHSL